ncbi:hypothetical protein MKW92_018829 [Papaver armeniacum]|nr:hypothetical protein MKW92_018829 [Papaver armeniacum]
MDSEADNHQIHIFFFPFIAYGHMIPTIDIAKLFAARGIKTTVILTPLSASFFSKSIDRERSLGLDIHIQVIKFPAVQAGLPEGFESVNDLTSLDMFSNLAQAIKMLQEPLERLIDEHKPDFIFADVLLPFATEAASKYGVPRFVFHGTSFFSQCVDQSLICHKPYEGITSDREAFVVPGLPDKIEMTRLQLHDKFKDEDESPTVASEQVQEAEQKSYGILVNSFYELEPAYEIHYGKVMGKRVWSIGLGKKTEIDEHFILNWLDSKKPQSVLYICFGTAGLEDSNLFHLGGKHNQERRGRREVFTYRFQDRMEGKGLIIREWAPQMLILDHPAVGGFMTHCGWNSILEGLSAGVPMITWPVFAEQFHNEIFVTQVLKIGIRVGVEKWNSWIEPEDVEARKEEIANAVSRLMGDGEEGQNMRTRAKELSKMARKNCERCRICNLDPYSKMDSESDHQLHIFFFPFVAYGHMIPTIDIAKLFAARGVKTTIILTPLNASVLSTSIDRGRSLGLDIHIQIIKFPGVEAGLPEGVESCDDMTSPEMVPKIFLAVKMLQEPLEQLIEEHRPDVIVADFKYGIPRFVFHGTSFYSQCVEESLFCHKPYIEMTRLQLSDHFKAENGFRTEVWEIFRDAEQRSYGILVNSFNELEPAYAMHYNKVLGKRAWAIGPVSLQRNRDSIDKVQRGKNTAINEHVVLKWLDSKEPDSVLYICFGSMARFSKAQLLEMAVGLEDSRISFIWVIRTIKKEEEESFLPEGFEDRMEGKGLIIREWAPQVLILDHPAVGGFMTHCGWNSILEGLSAGVPMITWPMFAEQFHNENFIAQVLKIGIPVGKEKIADVVSRLMGDGEEGINMRMRAKELGEKAKVAVEEGGSSYENLTALIQELQMVKKASTTRRRVPSSQVF